MAVDIKLKRSHTHSNIPTTSDLSEGEFAVNTYDGKMYMRDGSSNIVTVGNHYATDYENSTKVFYVTVATSATSHVHHGSGSSNKYKINGVFSPYLRLIPGITYRFDQSDSSNSGHPFRFYLDENKSTSYTTGVTTNGTAGSSGAYTEIVVSHSTPPVLHYQCSAHALMGWAAFVHTDNLTAFDTGDLTEGSNLYYTDARAQAVSINNVVEDTTPQLGGNLDLNSKAITGTGHLEPLGGTTYTPPSGGGSDTSTTTAIALTRGKEISVGHNGYVRNLIQANSSGQIQIGDGSTGLFGSILMQPGSNNGVKLGFNGADYKLETTTTGVQINSDDAGSTAGPELVLYRDSSSPADGDYLGQLQFKGKHDGGGDEIYAKVTGKISDSTQGTEDGLIETAIKGNGSFTIVSRQKSNELQLLNNVGLSVAGNTTLSGTLNGHTIPGGSGTLALTSDITSSDVVQDTTPQLGGDLDVNGNAIVSASNGNIAITPNGSGSVIIDGLSHPQADGNSGQVLTTNGSGQLSFASVGSLAGAGISNVSDDTSPQLGGNLDVVTHSIVSTSNRDINITPNGSGKVVVSSTGIEFGDGSVQTAAGADQGFAIAMGIALG